MVFLFCSRSVFLLSSMPERLPPLRIFFLLLDLVVRPYVPEEVEAEEEEEDADAEDIDSSAGGEVRDERGISVAVGHTGLKSRGVLGTMGESSGLQRRWMQISAALW